ncbi:type VII secretion-associated serine protease mycosin [Streptomyces sp. NPDC056374]|uniref:type VII secretion-associated serine protease mycosin n=1 Tax=unclassified Streptomyces TaxID=2593676 RepID=UPI0035E2476A
MRTSSIRRSRARATASAALGMLLVGIASVPAHAEGLRDRQWQLTTMGAEEIWQLSKGEGVTVAVIDSGVDKNNPDLRGQVLKGKDFYPAKPGDESTDFDGHGTSMAGHIAGTGERDGGNGAFGLAPGTKILPIRVPSGDDDGQSQADADAEFNRILPDAIRFAVDSGAKVINISIAVETSSPQVTSAVKYALDKNALIFAGVGNDGQKANKLMYPAATPGVVGVGAIDKKLTRIPMSQFGPQVDVVAPGQDTFAACGMGNGTCASSGTSNATALASAAAALIWSKHPDWTNNQVLKVMLNTIAAPTEGDKRNDYIGYGAIRPLRALKTPGDPGPADVRPIDDLDATASEPPSADPSAGASSAAPSASSGAPAPAATQAAGEDGGNTGLWIGLGIGAVVLIGAAIAVPVLRSRRG